MIHTESPFLTIYVNYRVWVRKIKSNCNQMKSGQRNQLAYWEVETVLLQLRQSASYPACSCD